jgi:hypothetical protein
VEACGNVCVAGGVTDVAAADPGGPLSHDEHLSQYLKAIDSGLHSVIQPRVVLRRRLHDANHGIKKSDARADYVRIVKAALDRRKAKALAADPGKG